MIKRFGFTLAEVLITLGIIGVVAAMTIPTLMNQTGQVAFKTGMKKATSVFNQAITMSVALDNSDFSVLTGGNAAGSIFNMFNSKMNVVKSTTAVDAQLGTPFNTAAVNYILYFNDGMVMTFPTATAGCVTQGQAGCRIVVVVNGVKKPNLLSTGTTVNPTAVQDEFVLDFFNQQVMPHDLPAQYALYGK